MQGQVSSRRGRQGRATVRDGSARRRGVSSVLAMMFLVLFGSLAVAMAVVAQGNLRTADSALKVSRAMSAAETGLVFATRRLTEETRRFVVEKGVIDEAYGEDLWLGTYGSGDGDVVVLPPSGYETGDVPAGIVHAVRDAHLADEHDLVVDPGDATLPEIDAYGTLRVRPIGLSTEAGAPYFRLRYTPLDDPDGQEQRIRVTSEGVDGDVVRVLEMEFRIAKKIEYAVISPNRIMIGKNVMIEGPLGSRFGGDDPTDLETANGDPLVMRSDFYYLDDTLSGKLHTFFDLVLTDDVDGDARLRPDHPVEGSGLDAHPELVDYDGNEYVDDYDLFLVTFDANGDLMVVYDADLAAASGHGALSEEFTGIDDQLARLIDDGVADRDGDGEVTSSDQALGYHDGVLDVNDLYAKLTGRLAFSVARADWEAAHGESYQTVVQGPVESGIDKAPVSFEVSDEELRLITTEMFGDTRTWYESQVPSDAPEDPVDFLAQVAAGGGANPDPEWEPVPFGSVGAYDYYERTVYEGITFNNVRIPRGCNGLFKDCTFVGVTYIESEPDCTHENWNYAGANDWSDDDGEGDIDADEIFPKFEGLTAMLGEDELADTRPYSNNVRFHNCTFLGSIAGDRLDEYTHWRNKVQMTGNTRFYLDPTDDEVAEQDDAAALIALLSGISEEDRQELAKSSLLMPGWSMDVGNFNNEVAEVPEDTAAVQLRGTMIAGILDIRGTADVFGTLLMTFLPEEGVGPLFYGGQTDAFNTTIGYFGPADGDPEGVDPDDAEFEGFGEIRLRYNPDTVLPDGIPWPVRMEPLPETYAEGGKS